MSVTLPIALMALAVGAAARVEDPAGGAAGDWPHIIGGRAAGVDEFPWAAALYRRGANPRSSHFCGAVLVHAEWVATAAHCVTGRPHDSLGVQVGGLALSEASGLHRGVSRILVHPWFDLQTAEADLALLQLDNPVSTTPLRLLTRERTELADAGATATVVGWGATDDAGGQFPDQLQAVELPLVDRTVCNLPESYDGRVSDGMLCAGFADGSADACRGDSGGPLIVSPAEEGPYLAGMTSWGDGCAQPLKYGVYTRIPSFIRWIETQLHHSPTSPIPLQFVASLPDPGFIGLAAKNFSAGNLEMKGRLLDQEGVPTSPVEVRIGLGPGAQTAFLTADLGGMSSASILAFDQPRQEFALVFLAGDWQRRQLDGLSVPRRRTYEGLIPLRPGADAEFFLYNPDPVHSAEVVIEARLADGSLREESRHQVRPSGTIRWEIGSSELSEAGYLRVASVQGIAALGLQSDQGTALTALSAQEPKLRREIFLPHLFASGPGELTEIQIQNSGTTDCRLVLRTSADSEPAPGIYTAELPPMALFSGNPLRWQKTVPASPREHDPDPDPLGEVFAGTGVVRLEAAGGGPCRIAGAIRYSIRGAAAAALVPFPDPAHRQWLPYLVDSAEAGMYTGLAVQNPQEVPVLVRLRYLRPDGAPSAEVERTIAPGRRLVGLLREAVWFGDEFNAVGGHLQLIADHPVAAISLMGDDSGETLAVLEWLGP